MSLKIDVSASFTGLLQVVKKIKNYNMADRFFLMFNLVTTHVVS